MLTFGDKLICFTFEKCQINGCFEQKVANPLKLGLCVCFLQLW